MSGHRPPDCHCEDWPCCGCGEIDPRAEEETYQEMLELGIDPDDDCDCHPEEIAIQRERDMEDRDWDWERDVEDMHDQMVEDRMMGGGY